MLTAQTYKNDDTQRHKEPGEKSLISDVHLLVHYYNFETNKMVAREINVAPGGAQRAPAFGVVVAGCV